MIRSALVVAAGLCLSSVASADPATVDTSHIPVQVGTVAPGQGPRVVVDLPAGYQGTRPIAASGESNLLYLNRCTGGCTVHTAGTDSASSSQTTIGTPGDHVLSEYADAAGDTGTLADDEWNQVLACVKEIYSPFNMTVTDVKPANGLTYTEEIIAGKANELLGAGGAGILGIALLTQDCSPVDNAIAFAFADSHGPNDRVFNICWTAGQEAAHEYGLDHEYSFDDGTSACNDPMTYRTDCGGEKFFRNKQAMCGDVPQANGVIPRACRCGGEQNSHLKILSVFGPGQSTVPAPTVSVTFPAAGATTLGAVVAGKAFSKRGVDHVDLWLNNYKWATTPGAAFGQEGQPESTYTLTVPTTVPNSIVDVQLKAYDDLGLETDSDVLTVTKGAACTDASTCLAGMTCDAGKCEWPAATGALGDVCTYPQFCTSGECTENSNDGMSYCTHDCLPGIADSCEAGYTCFGPDQAHGQCFADDGSGGGGCCSVEGSSGNGWWVHALFGAGVLGLVLRRRNRARA
ncbi:MAG TPA: hypothetical protein VGM88_02880 [Kofleriaceae bacterium]|jgi:hypothetical protein